MDIAAWLRSLELEQYEPAFRENEIDAEVLQELNEPDLEKLGLPLGWRKSTAGSPRASTPPISRTPRRCSTNWKGDDAKK